MYSLLVKERAKSMVDEAYVWYEEQRLGLGEEFLQELENCTNKILENPDGFGFIEKEFRRVKLKRFPYIVIYEIIEFEIIIYAVFHTRKNPNSRLKD